eukprot:scaffold5419_cov128-Cylindrotheca_fusiformis.AAC.1
MANMSWKFSSVERVDSVMAIQGHTCCKTLLLLKFSKQILLCACVCVWHSQNQECVPYYDY